MEVFLLVRQTRVAVLVYPIYILTVHRGTQIIFWGSGELAHSPRCQRYWEPFPNDTNKRFVFQPITALTLSSVCIENLVRPANQCDSLAGVTPIFLAKSFFKILLFLQYWFTASCMDSCICYHLVFAICRLLIL